MMITTIKKMAENKKMMTNMTKQVSKRHGQADRDHRKTKTPMMMMNRTKMMMLNIKNKKKEMCN